LAGPVTVTTSANTALLHTPKKFCFRNPPGGVWAIRVVGKASNMPAATPTAIHPNLVRIMQLLYRLVGRPDPGSTRVRPSR
jgi:hypothetical protein